MAAAPTYGARATPAYKHTANSPGSQLIMSSAPTERAAIIGVRRRLRLNRGVGFACRRQDERDLDLYFFGFVETDLTGYILFIAVNCYYYKHKAYTYFGLIY